MTVEEADELLKRMIDLCADVEVAESVGWCSRGRGSRAKNAVVEVDVEVAGVEEVAVEPRA